MMVVGESGLGKSTLINSLFLTDIYGAEYPGPSQRVKKTSKVNYIGDFFPVQFHFFQVKQFSELNLNRCCTCWLLLVVGALCSELSTQLNPFLSVSLFFYYTLVSAPTRSSILSLCQVEQTRITVRESGVQLNLSCVDTPGFGDSVNNDKCWEPIIEACVLSSLRIRFCTVWSELKLRAPPSCKRRSFPFELRLEFTLSRSK